ncbi:TPA: hypothetical protein R9A92_000391 [Campylobacter coli]|nr:hypothetical protein [Campylobacter coli]HEF3311491.1 hypothetical protein [Campylobacter coli]HEF3314936.1 hypothetical protein [Campylobacter coli]HEF3341243.1 hypothetical protein [Campylobacter coli]HEF3351817.1 hypothetical protein [Campylobacter coli]
MDEIQSLKAQLNNLLLRVSELESKVGTLEKRLNDKDFQVLNETPNL